MPEALPLTSAAGLGAWAELAVAPLGAVLPVSALGGRRRASAGFQLAQPLHRRLVLVALLVRQVHLGPREGQQHAALHPALLKA